jgi:plastocyanin
MLSKNDDNKTVLATLALMLLSLSVASSIAISAPHYASAQGVTGQGGGYATNATMMGASNATNATMMGASNATNDSQPHTVTSGSNGQPDNKFNSSPNFNPLLNPGQTFSFTFTEEGNYPYFCTLHPNMVGTVIVS